MKRHPQVAVLYNNGGDDHIDKTNLTVAEAKRYIASQPEQPDCPINYFTIPMNQLENYKRQHSVQEGNWTQ